MQGSPALFQRSAIILEIINLRCSKSSFLLSTIFRKLEIATKLSKNQISQNFHEREINQIIKNHQRYKCSNTLSKSNTDVVHQLCRLKAQLAQVQEISSTKLTFMQFHLHEKKIYSFSTFNMRPC